MKTSRSLRNGKQTAYEWCLLVSGCIIYAMSMVWFNDVTVIPGSMLGIAAAVNKIAGWPVGMMNLLLNIPIMAVAKSIDLVMFCDQKMRADNSAESTNL